MLSSSQSRVVSGRVRLSRRKDEVVNILFTTAGDAIAPKEIRKKIARFGYNRAVHRIIQGSNTLDRKGEVFIKCASLILSNFQMTRSGPLKGNANQIELLQGCWKEVRDNLVRIRDSVLKSGCSRDRFLLELDQHRREELIS